MQPARWIDRGDSDQMRHHARTTIVTACIAAVVAVGAPAQAFSGGGTTNDNGYGARVEVHLSGDVSQGAVGSVPGPPPMCWWENLSGTMLSTDKVDTSDPAAVQEVLRGAGPALPHRARRDRSARHPARGVLQERDRAGEGRSADDLLLAADP